MQDHLRSEPAVLVQNELVIGFNLAQGELRVIVEEAWLAGFVIRVEWFDLRDCGYTEVDLSASERLSGLAVEENGKTM